ncbi:MAG: hypothetical protein M0Z63_10085 [Actinomycetota bacterium]|nr:hypothetical protein [Actinomycetota bacterium]
MTSTSRVGLVAIVVAVASIGAPSLAAAATPPHATPVLAQSASGCTMSISPTSGPVGTLVSIEGSTAGCAGNAGGGALGFSDEHAGVPVPNVNDLLPQHGSFAYSFRIPAVMPSGNWYAAADQYEGGGPVGPGPAVFRVTMGAPLQATFDVTAPAAGWDDYSAIMATRSGAVGYDLVRSDGYLDGFGSSLPPPGNAGGIALNAPIAGATFTPDGAGYWMTAKDGGVFSFGDAAFYGSMGGQHLNAQVVGMAATPDGHGYWLVAADGGVFSFGDAPFEGSAAAGPQQFPMVGMAATPDGRGYWLLGQDGGLFTFGDAPFYGSGRGS